MVKWLLTMIRSEPDPIRGWTKTDIDALDIAAALERNNIPFKTVLMRDIMMNNPMPYTGEDTVFVQGTVSSVRDLLRRYGWLSWAPMDSLKCSNYYPYFLPYILQQEHVFLPAKDLAHNWCSVVKWMGSDGGLFVRPDGNTKGFTGGVFSRKQFQEDILGTISADTMVVAAKPVVILKEWRVLTVNGEVVTGSSYQPEEAEGVPSEWSDWNPICFREAVRKLYLDAKEKGYDALPSMIHFDFAQTETGIRLLELSAVNCAGYYAMNLDKAVTAITKQAELEYSQL